MTDKKTQLIDEYFKTEVKNNKLSIYVKIIDWDGHTPVSSWSLARSLPKDTSQDKIDKAISDTLNNKKFFRICGECNERNPEGHMSEFYCHSCAEKNHGVDF